MESERSLTFFMVDDIGPWYTTVVSLSSFPSAELLGPTLILPSSTLVVAAAARDANRFEKYVSMDIEEQSSLLEGG